MKMGLHKSKLNVAQIQKKAMKYDGMKALRLENLDINSLVSAEGYDNVTPLWLAVRFNDLELADLLLKADADVNSTCGDLNHSPLHTATSNHNVKMVKLLLGYGAKPDVLDKWNYSPLMYAVIHYEPYTVNQLVTLLLEAGADANFGATISSDGAHSKATVNADLEELYNIDIHSTYMREPMGPTSGTALHHAAQNPHLPSSTLELLLQAGADVNNRNLYGQMPLIGALMDTFYDYHTHVKYHAELLIRQGTKVNVADIRGWTPLHYASLRGSVPCIKLLLEAGADCNLASHKEEVPLWILLANGYLEASKYLIQNGCDIDYPMSTYNIVGLNANVDICRYGTMVPIEFAICNQYFDLASLLLLAGCSVLPNTWLGPRGSFVQSNSRYDEFITFLNELKKKQTLVPHLAEICFKTIRKQLGQGIMYKLDLLQLPQSLKDFISLKS